MYTHTHTHPGYTCIYTDLPRIYMYIYRFIYVCLSMYIKTHTNIHTHVTHHTEAQTLLSIHTQSNLNGFLGNSPYFGPSKNPTTTLSSTHITTTHRSKTMSEKKHPQREKKPQWKKNHTSLTHRNHTLLLNWLGSFFAKVPFSLRQIFFFCERSLCFGMSNSDTITPSV